LRRAPVFNELVLKKTNMMMEMRRRWRRITTTEATTTTGTITTIITICNDSVFYRIECYSSNTPDLYLEVLTLHLSWGVSYLEAFLGFTWSLQANAGIVPTQLLISRSFPVHQ
jgi:hypothetical protein